MYAKHIYKHPVRKLVTKCTRTNNNDQLEEQQAPQQKKRRHAKQAGSRKATVWHAKLRGDTSAPMKTQPGPRPALGEDARERAGGNGNHFQRLYVQHSGRGVPQPATQSNTGRNIEYFQQSAIHREAAFRAGVSVREANDS